MNGDERPAAGQKGGQALILASKSPRRQGLLRDMGLLFRVEEADTDETPPDGASPEEAAVAIARRKAEAVRALCAPHDVIIAADTTVVLGDAVLGKPHDSADAYRMLESLSGQTHTVLTGVVVSCGETVRYTCVASRVTFRVLSPREIAAYVATGEPMDKAGAYGAQGRGAWLVSHIDGDYFNVVGLPMATLGEMLADFGVDVWAV